MLARIGLRKRADNSVTVPPPSSFDEEFDPKAFNPFDQPDMGITPDGRPTSQFSDTPYTPVKSPLQTLDEFLAKKEDPTASSSKVTWGNTPNRIALGTQAMSGRDGRPRMGVKSSSEPAFRRVSGKRPLRAASFPTTIIEEDRNQEDETPEPSFIKITGRHVPRPGCPEIRGPYDHRVHHIEDHSSPIRGPLSDFTDQRYTAGRCLPNQGLARQQVLNVRIPEQQGVAVTGPLSPRHLITGSQDSGVAHLVYPDGTIKGKTPVRRSPARDDDDRDILPSQLDRQKRAQDQRRDFQVSLARSRSNRSQHLVDGKLSGVARGGNRCQEQDRERYLQRTSAESAEQALKSSSDQATEYTAIVDNERRKLEDILDGHMDKILDSRKSTKGTMGKIAAEKPVEVVHQLEEMMSHRGVVGMTWPDEPLRREEGEGEEENRDMVEEEKEKESKPRWIRQIKARVTGKKV